MKTPTQKDDTFLTDVREASGVGINIWWLGQSGFLLQVEGRHALVDPYLSDSLTAKYADTDKPHVRITERVVAPERLDFIDVVSSSHNHTDHLDGETLRPLMRVNPDLDVLVPEANREFAAGRLQVDPSRLTGMTDGQPHATAGFTFHPVPAAHEELERDEAGCCTHLGYVIEAGTRTVYHSGDTVRYEGMVGRLRSFEIDVAILPINGSDPSRGVAGNLDGPKAVQLARDIEADLLIPCHFDMFEFNTVSPDAFTQAARSANQPYHLLQNGARLSLE